MTTQDHIAWLRLIRTRNIGTITFRKLLSRYGTAQNALEALPELSKRAGGKPLKPPPASVAEKEIRALNKIGGKLLCLNDSDYPEILASCDDAPPVLSVIGNTDLLQKPSIAMVGARNSSLNGCKFAEKLSRDLGSRDIVVTSGLARGIDTSAHKGALQTGTIAVVAGGIDVVYPEENQKLYEDICEKGLVIAESPLGQKPFAQSFPRRNRIVSGLSQGTIVVEATLRSGSLITARLAGEQGRDVYAIPGHPLDPRAAGPNKLIRDGAILTRNADDIMQNMLSSRPLTLFENNASDFNFEFANENEIPDNAHEKIIEHLSFTPIHTDEILRATDFDIPVLQTLLLELELAGRITKHPGGRVALLSA